MKKILIAYFSASGVTAKKAAMLADAAKAADMTADLYEIRPETPYTKEDLDWRNASSRSSVEMKNKSFRPALASTDADVAPYDTVFLGFPIWWYVAPTIVNTFLEAYDFSGKKVVLFATSGSSGFGKTAEELRPSAPSAEFVEGDMLNGVVTDGKLKKLLSLG